MKKQSLAKYEIWIFFAAILVINTVFVFGIAEGWIDRGHFGRGRFWLLGSVLAAVVFLSRGFWATVDLIRPLSVWRVSPLWFVAAGLWPAAFASAFVAVKTLVTGEPWEPLSPNPGILARQNILLTILVSSLVGEIVWVGYAIRSLGKRYSRLFAVVVTGTVWAAWWMPMVHYEIGVVPNLSAIGLWMNMIGIAFFCTFFYTITGSGLVIFVMQFCYNSAMLTIPVMPNSGGPLTYDIFAASYMIAGYLSVTFLMPRLQNRGGPSARPSFAH